jgi:hypothetical protein
MSEASRPPGVVAICTDPQGRVIASAACFDTGGAGGFTLVENQSRVAMQRLRDGVIAAYCSDVILPAISSNRREDICDGMRRLGWRFTAQPINHAKE